MSDQTKQNYFLTGVLKDNPDSLEFISHRSDTANPLPQSEKFMLLFEAIQNKRPGIAEAILEKMIEFDSKNQPCKISHSTVVKNNDINYFCNPEDSFVNAVKNSDLIESTILNCDLRLLETLFDEGINVNPLYCNHLLHIAVENNIIEFIDLLLNRGADVDARNSEDMTPLHVATMKRFLTIAQKLLDKGANVNCTIYDLKKQNTKIYNNPEDANERITERLLKTGTVAEEVAMTPLEIYSEDNVNVAYEKSKNRGNYVGSSIFFAIQNADVAMTKLLLSRGADVPHNPNVLNAVIDSGNLDIIECFTRRNIDINDKGEEEETALHRAILVHSSEDVKVEIIKLLLNRGASVCCRNKSGQTPLHLAAQKGYAKLVATLLEYNPNELDLRSSKDTLSEFPFSYRRDFRSKNKINQFYAKNKDATTRFCLSVQKDNRKLAETLPEFRPGKDNSKNSEDYSARFLIFGENECGFKEKAAQLHAKNDIGETPLHMASSRNHQEVVEILLKHGIDIDCRTIFGKTALDVAFENGCRQTFLVLLKYGSDIDVAYTANNPDQNRPSFCLIKSHRGEFIISNKYCVESIAKHIVKMKTAGRSVSRGNLKCLAKHDETVNSYYRECDEEIRKLKQEKIERNISLYDFLWKKSNQLAIYAKNKRVVRTLESKYLTYLFPIYSDMIRYNFKRGQVRELLMNISLNSWNSSIEYYLPPEVVVTDIFRYLENEDLENFIEACHAPCV